MPVGLKSFCASLIFTVGVAGSAAAYCPEPMTFTSQSLVAQVKAQLDWLLCLHSEQVGSLNRHADSINDLADNLNRLAALIRADGDRIDGIVMREREDCDAASVLNARLEDLEARVRLSEEAR